MEVLVVALVCISSIIGKVFFNFCITLIEKKFKSYPLPLALSGIAFLLAWVVGIGFFLLVLWIFEWINF